jgi:hypothetical protein
LKAQMTSPFVGRLSLKTATLFDSEICFDNIFK